MFEPQNPIIKKESQEINLLLQFLKTEDDADQ